MQTITSKKFGGGLGSTGSSPAGGGDSSSSQSSPAGNGNGYGNLTREGSNGGSDYPRVSPRGFGGGGGASREELVDLFGQLETRMMARLDAVLGAQGGGGAEALLPRGERRP